MSQAGSAFLYLWNDYDEAHRAEYEEWHTFEHVPERVSLPGFVAGYQYSSDDPAAATYFTAYELTSLDVLQSDAYADVVDHPTPWSAKMRPAFQNVFRLPSTVVASQGMGLSGLVAVIVFELPSAVETAAHALSTSLSAYHASNRLTGFQLSVADEIPAYKVFEQTASLEHQNTLLVAVLAGTSEPALHHVAEDFVQFATAEAGVTSVLRHDIYRFFFGVHAQDVFPSHRRAIHASEAQRHTALAADGKDSRHASPQQAHDWGGE
ncbi:MAG: hypothetical protein AAF234_03220 [Pseudomonadota bacterium]